MGNKRSRIFVDAGFQGRLLGRLVAYWFVYHVALWHVMFFFTLVGASMNQDPSAPPKGFWTLYRNFAADHASVIVCFLVMLPILGRDLLKFSHRLAGPLVRLRRFMEAAAEGKPLNPITLRKGDLLTEFVGAFNRMGTIWNSSLKQPKPAASEATALDLVEAAH
jgi:hypothetical protein